MQTRLSEVSNTIFKYFVIFSIIFMWLNFYSRNIMPVFLASIIFTIIVGKIIAIFEVKKKNRIKLSQLDNKKMQDISLQLLLNSNKENLQFFANIYNKNDQKIIDEIVKVFKLDEVLNQRAKTLSGGFKRRLSIAIALISQPKILFLDEPTLGLDVLARRELWQIIKKLKQNVTIILTSHYLEEIENLCDKVAILSKGKLLQIGTVKEIQQLTNTEKFEDAFVQLVENVNE